MAYLKNVILKLFETGQKEALLPVVGMIMQFSPAELQRCRYARAVTTLRIIHAKNICCCILHRAVIEAEKAAAELAGHGDAAGHGDVTFMGSFAKLLG